MTENILPKNYWELQEIYRTMSGLYTEIETNKKVLTKDLRDELENLLEKVYSVMKEKSMNEFWKTEFRKLSDLKIV